MERSSEGFLSVWPIQPGIHETSWARCPNANDLGWGFHWNFPSGTRSRTRRVVFTSCSNSGRSVSAMLIVFP